MMLGDPWLAHVPTARRRVRSLQMERVVRVFECFADAEAADLDDWLALSGEERMRIGESMRIESFADGAAPFVRELRVRALGAEEE